MNTQDRVTQFSPCRRYRYTLWREWNKFRGDQREIPFDNELKPVGHPDWNPSTYLMVIGLNPSTADETKDDPTIRKCIGFAKRLGYGALCMTNLFAFRATDPRKMKSELDPVGEENNLHLKTIASGAGNIIAAWGTNGSHLNRNREVFELISGPPILRTLCCLRMTKSGHPEHPLYVPYDARPVIYNDLDLAAAK